jgi:hypothetical protein
MRNRSVPVIFESPLVQLTKDNDDPSFGCSAYRYGSGVPSVVGMFHIAYILSSLLVGEVQKNLRKQMDFKKMT